MSARCRRPSDASANTTARFAVQLWGENQAAASTAVADITSVVVGLVGASYSAMIPGVAPFTEVY